MAVYNADDPRKQLTPMQRLALGGSDAPSATGVPDMPPPSTGFMPAMPHLASAIREETGGGGVPPNFDVSAPPIPMPRLSMLGRTDPGGAAAPPANFAAEHVSDTGGDGEGSAPPPPPAPAPAPAPPAATGDDSKYNWIFGSAPPAPILTDGVTGQIGPDGTTTSPVVGTSYGDPPQTVSAAAPPGTQLTNGTTVGASDPNAGVGDTIDSDPGYQAQKAEDERLLNQAASGSLAATKDLLLGYGSQTLAKQTLDELLKDPRIAAIFTPADEAAFLASISDNPDTSMSTLARTARGQREQAAQTDEGFNDNNLFYSGARAKGLGDQSYAFQTQSADNRAKVDSALGNVLASYRSAQDAARAGDLGAYQAAIDRAMQEALAYGTGTDPTAKAPAGPPSSSSTPSTSNSTKNPAKNPGKNGNAKAPSAKANAAALKALAARSVALNAAHNLPKQSTKKRKQPPTYSGRH